MNLRWWHKLSLIFVFLTAIDFLVTSSLFTVSNMAALAILVIGFLFWATTIRKHQDEKYSMVQLVSNEWGEENVEVEEK